jgi:hypothetical protein
MQLKLNILLKDKHTNHIFAMCMNFVILYTNLFITIDVNTSKGESHTRTQ